MENFCYDPKRLVQLSGDGNGVGCLPPSIISILQKQRQFMSGMMTLRQLSFSELDLALHSAIIPDQVDTLKAFEVERTLSTKYDLIPRLEDDRFLCSFSHIFGGGYSAGYYSYKWSEVYSADAYNEFDGKYNEELSRVGEKYKNTVLALGGGSEPADVWKQFCGRTDANVDALLKYDGLDNIKVTQ